MSADEIAKLIAGGETLTVEFKSDREKLSDRALVEALAEMANTDGGVLILGVEDGTGEITGLHSRHRGHGTPTAMIANRTVPPLHVSVAEAVLEGRPLSVMTVPSVPGVTAAWIAFSRASCATDARNRSMPSASLTWYFAYLARRPTSISLIL